MRYKNVHEKKRGRQKAGCWGEIEEINSKTLNFVLKKNVKLLIFLVFIFPQYENACFPHGFVCLCSLIQPSAEETFRGR